VLNVEPRIRLAVVVSSLLTTAVPTTTRGQALTHPVDRVRIIQSFGETKHCKPGPNGEQWRHTGWDYGAKTPGVAGDAVKAAGDGEVVAALEGSNHGLGRTIIVRHTSNVITLYGHLKQIVVTGGRVSRGDTKGRHEPQSWHFFLATTSLVTIEALPFDWLEAPFIFYERNGEKGVEYIAFQGNQQTEGIADYYWRLSARYAHMIGRAVLSDAPTPIKVERQQFEAGNILTFTKNRAAGVSIDTSA
jgi:hypothetical protein